MEKSTIYKENNYKRVNKEAENVKDNRKKKNKKGLLKLKAVGAALVIVIFSSKVYPKMKATKEVEKTTFEQQLSKNEKYTYVDELLSKKARKNIDELEGYLEVSDKLSDLNDRIYLIEAYSKIPKAISKREEYDKLDKSKYTPKEIKKDIKFLNDYLDKYESGEIQLDLPNEENKAFYEKVSKTLREDVAVCNNKIAEGYSELKDLYQIFITSAYLQKSSLPVEKAKNMNYDEIEKYKFKYNASDFPKEVRPKFEYKVSIDKFKNIFDKLSKNSSDVEWGTKEVYSDYNQDRNQIIKNALDYAKLLFYYDYEIEKKGIFESDTRLTGSLNYQKINARNKTKKR